MSATQPMTSTLANALWPTRINPAFRAILLVAAGAALLTISAKIQVPFWPVPATLQTLALPLIAAAFGARLGVATVVAYLAAGLAGLPVFAGPSAGPLYIFGPTAGYLLGGIPAAWIVGTVAERVGNRILPLFGAMALADLLVFALGFGWLAIYVRNAGAAFTAGVEPFILGDLVKVALAAALISAGWAGVKRLRG